MPFGMDRWSFEKREFYRLWKDAGFDQGVKKELMKKAGYTQNQIKSNMGEKNINKIIIAKMDRTRGIRLDDLVRTHAEQLAATHAQFPTRPDNSARMRALELAYKMRDAIPNPRLQIQSESTNNVNITIETLRHAEEATGDKIIDMIPEEDWIDEEPEGLLGEGDGETPSIVDQVEQSS